VHGSAATATGGEAPLPLVAKFVPLRRCVTVLAAQRSGSLFPLRK